VKILHTTDLHYTKEWYKWIYDQQDNFDIFCISGDFLDESKDDDISVQIEWVSEWLNSFSKPLFVCSGNHDIVDYDWLDSISSIYSDTTIKIIDDISIGCISYIVPDFYEYDDCDIILYHIPPAFCDTSISSKDHKDYGDRELYQAIKSSIIKPKILLCGHIHDPIKDQIKIKNTLISNPASNIFGNIPHHTIFDIVKPF
jgi:Icc-related predicted phosphoesterase